MERIDINKKEFIDYARHEIRDCLKSKAEFTHNIISLHLQQIADLYGHNEANKLIDEFDLIKIGISKKEKP